MSREKLSTDRADPPVEVEHREDEGSLRDPDAGKSEEERADLV